MKIKKKSKTRLAAKRKPTRRYDNSAREQQSDLNRQKIIESYVDLVSAKGHDITLETLAKKTKISLRTLFRFFGDKEKLNEEIELYLTRYLSPIANELERMEVADYAAFSYQVFDRYEKLFKAYLHTNLGQLSRRVLRRRFYDMLVSKMAAAVSEKRGTEGRNLSAKDMVKLRFAANLISAQIWNDMHENYGLTGGDTAPAAKWAIQTLLNDLYMTL
jgi:AcrR family transcriptional regulator